MTENAIELIRIAGLPVIVLGAILAYVRVVRR